MNCLEHSICISLEATVKVTIQEFVLFFFWKRFTWTKLLLATFKVMYFDTIVDTREGLNRIMGHFTSIECNYKRWEYRTGWQVKAKALDKGQLISKWFFGVVDFLQKTNENKSHSSKVEFIRSFFGGNRWPQKPFWN